jgi:hypothetical protein
MIRSTLGYLGTGSTGLSTDNWATGAMPLTRSDHPAQGCNEDLVEGSQVRSDATGFPSRGMT